VEMNGEEEAEMRVRGNGSKCALGKSMAYNMI